MAGDLQPLDEKFAIVESDGRPTLYFIKWAQQRQIDITASITSEQFNELLLAYLLAHQLQEGDGIALTPSGNIDDSPEISVRNGTGLDFDGMQNLKIADTAVTPGTYGDATHVGQFTVDQQGRITAATDVAISGGGGGGAWTTIHSSTIAAPTPGVDIDVTGYNEVSIIARAITVAANGFLCVLPSTDGGVTFFKTTPDIVNLNDAGSETTTFVGISTSTSAGGARSIGGTINGVSRNDCPKPMFNYSRAGLVRLFQANNNPITHIRLGNITGSGAAYINLTGGTVYVMGR